MNAVRNPSTTSRASRSLAAAILLAFSPSFARAAPEPPRASGVTVDVSTFRNSKGMLGCRLYSGGAGFPESSKGTVERRVAISGATARCTFADLPPGTYAVAVMHDENDNQKLDKNFLGIPIEGYGVSNNHTHAMSSPTWDESKFVVAAGQNVRLAVALRY